MFRLVLILLALFAAPPHAVRAAEFDVDAPGSILRRLQYCQDCGAALLVTRVRPGVLVRCSDCGREQKRLQDQYLLTQAYQLCRLCRSPLNPKGKKAGDVVECGNCHTRQTLGRDAFPTGDRVAGIGYRPGFPPGSGKKHLLYSPDTPDAGLTPVPLPAASGDPIHPDTIAAIRVPYPDRDLLRQRPPAGVEAPRGWVASRPGADDTHELPPVPEAVPGSETITLTGGSVDDAAGALAAADITSPGAGEALDVPAVTVDMFGGGSPAGAFAAASAAVAASGGTTTAGTGGSVVQPASAREDRSVAARVDGQPIYFAEVRRIVDPVVERLRQSGELDDASLSAKEKELVREVANRLVERELAFREAEIMGLKPDQAEARVREAELAALVPDGAVDVRREAERDVVLADLRRRVAGRPGGISPGAAREYYQRHKHERQVERLTALLPLVVYQDRGYRQDRRSYQDIAQDISAELERGGRFDDLRLRHDEFAPEIGVSDASSPELLPDAAYASEILASVGEFHKGAVFGPLFLEGMALFAKVVDERQAGPVPFEEVEKEIRARLEAEQAEKTFTEWLSRLKKRANIEFFL